MARLSPSSHLFEPLGLRHQGAGERLGVGLCHDGVPIGNESVTTVHRLDDAVLVEGDQAPSVVAFQQSATDGNAWADPSGLCGFDLFYRDSITSSPRWGVFPALRMARVTVR